MEAYEHRARAREALRGNWVTAVLVYFVDFIQFKESVSGIFKEVHIAKNNGDFSWGTVVATLLCCIFFVTLNHHLSKKFKGEK